MIYATTRPNVCQSLFNYQQFGQATIILFFTVSVTFKIKNFGDSASPLVANISLCVFRALFSAWIYRTYLSQLSYVL